MAKRLMSAVVAGAILIALPACGAKTDEATRAAGITPTNAIALVSVNLDPSIEQKRNLLSIARKFPAASDKVKGEFDETRDQLLSDLVKEGGLDFQRDVKPWLGDEVALVVLPPAAAGGSVLVGVFVQTTDEAKAKAALEKTRKGGDFSGDYRVIDGFVVISDQDDAADNPKLLDRIEGQSKKDDGGLAKADRFTEMVDELAGDRLVLAWADVEEALRQATYGQSVPGLDLSKLFKNGGAVAVDFHAAKEALVLQGVSRPFGQTKAGTAALTEGLPAGTLGALTLFDFGTAVREVLKIVGGAGGGGENISDLIKSQTGIDLDADVLSWMEGEFVLVAGAVPPGQPFPDFALVVEPSDKAKAAAAIPRIVEAIRARAGIPLEEKKLADGTTAYVLPESVVDDAGFAAAMALFEDRFVLANRQEYLEQLRKDASPSLGDSSTYRAVVGEGSSKTVGQLVLQIDPIREAFENALLGGDAEARASYEKEVKANLVPLGGLGILARREGKFDRFEMKLTFD